MLRSLDISTSALVAQRQRMNTIAGNIANINSTRNQKGEISPFQRRIVTFAAQSESQSSQGGGVGVNYQVEVDPFAKNRVAYEPNHPDANEQGYVSFPDIDLTTEFVNAVEASRAYEANIAAIDITKGMLQQTLKILV